MIEQERGDHPRPTARCFLTRPTLYVCFILVFVVPALLYRGWADSIFSCQAKGYSSDRYLAYCNGSDYGEFEHGAFWFGLEPSALKFASGAEVMFLGDSRLQFAFSNIPTSDWFSSIQAKYYLLGFGEYENAVFIQKLLRKLQPQAKAYVINIDGFFDHIEHPAAKVVMHDDRAQSTYEVKHIWQSIHEPICTRLSAICGNKYAIFRSRETGDWRATGKMPGSRLRLPVSYDENIVRDEIDARAVFAAEFLSRLPVTRDCIVLTIVPTVKTKRAAANAVADALGMNLISPELDGLRTFDGSHLDQASAARWSPVFLRAAAAQIRHCLDSYPVSSMQPRP
jgi:hypothetical protein